jgi:hypothetical protein
MEPGGCNRQQSAADRANLKTVRTSQIRATSCHRLPKTFHGKEGSTVRVRQRALQKRRTRGFSFRADLQVVEGDAGMEPLVEPSGPKRHSWKSFCTATDAKRRRNDPCTCGSGRKWKHCRRLTSSQDRPDDLSGYLETPPRPRSARRGVRIRYGYRRVRERRNEWLPSRSQDSQQRIKPLRRPVGATGGNQWQMRFPAPASSAATLSRSPHGREER